MACSSTVQRRSLIITYYVCHVIRNMSSRRLFARLSTSIIFIVTSLTRWRDSNTLRGAVILPLWQAGWNAAKPPWPPSCARTFTYTRVSRSAPHTSMYTTRCTCTRGQPPFRKSSFFKITRQRACARVSVMCTRSDYDGYFAADIHRYVAYVDRHTIWKYGCKSNLY